MQVCLDRYKQFGTAGNASKIKVQTLDEFAARYASGELAATTKTAVTV